MPFYPPLPWLSAPGPFPPRAAGRRRRRRAPVAAGEEGLALPSRDQAVEESASENAEMNDGDQTPTEEPAESLASTAAVPSDAEVDTPSTSHPPSEVDLAHVTTPSAVTPSAQSSATATKHARTATIPAIPLIPIKSAKAPSTASTTQKSVKSPIANQQTPGKPADGSLPAGDEVEDTTKAASPPKPVAPKSWAELLRAKNAPVAAQPAATAAAPTTPVTNGVAPVNGPTVPRSNTLADVLASFSVDSEKKVSFTEPRGLVNTGNLCYMNSVGQIRWLPYFQLLTVLQILQVLLFCVPFYDFLDQVAKRAVHSFKSETPLVDALYVIPL
jgi:ubiquitin carboxyl-terminal hydrolase 10